MPQQNQQQQGQASAGQPNVRVIPIFVEGRDQPVINRDLPDSSSSGSIPEMGQMPRQEMPRMAPTMDFGNDMPSFTHGSIFDRAKDFPVRRNFPTAQEFFNRGASPSRESPIRQVPVNHANEPAFAPFQSQPQQQQYMPPRRQQPSPTQVPFPPNKQPRSRTSSRNSEEPPVQVQQPEPRQVPIHRQSPSPQQPQSQQQQQSAAPEQEPTMEEPKPQPVREGPIEKIQKIQKDVLDLMTQVEQFNGRTRKDKEYIYLDEMLTQSLIRLDDVETQGKENVKLARKEAVKCINRCLSVLEAKAEAAEQQMREFGNGPGSENMETNDTNGADPGNTQTETNMDVDSSNEPPSKQSSRTSIYDNHDPNAASSQSNVPRQQAGSKESTPKPEQTLSQHVNSARGSKENSPVTNNSTDRINKEPTPPASVPQKSGSGSSQK